MQNHITTVSTSPFAAFRHKNYRLWFIGQLISLAGSWMESTAQGYLLYSLTGSEVYLGLVGFVSGIPSWIFMIYGGVIADRVPRRTLLIITQAGMMIPSFTIAILVFMNWIQPWHILVTAFLLGVANAFDVPARQSLVADLVSKEDMPNAIAYNSFIFNIGMIAGPAAGALLYAAAGPGWCFTINGLSFIAVIVALTMMRIAIAPRTQESRRALSAITEGFRYMRADRLSLSLSISTLVINLFGFGMLVLLPAWAVDILKGNVTTFGFLTSARGAGAIIGALAIAFFASYGMRGKMWTIGSLLGPLAIAAFGLSKTLPFALFWLAVFGLALIITLNNSNAMIQSRVPDDLRGRVMSIYSLMFMGGGPIGSLFAGTLAGATSAPTTILVCAAILFIYAVLILFVSPEVRRME